MSYATMDHAGWVERNNAVCRQRRKTPKKDSDGNVVGFHAAPAKLTPFQAKVMDIVGIMEGGIYNAGVAWQTVIWQYGGDGVSLVLHSGRGFSTFDFDGLTKFVLLCHVARIRGSIENAGPGRWRLSFYQRDRDGGMSRRHPSIKEAVAAFEAYLPKDHVLRWKEPWRAVLARQWRRALKIIVPRVFATRSAALRHTPTKGN